MNTTFYCKLCGAKQVRYICNDFICSGCYQFYSATRTYILQNRRIPRVRMQLLSSFLNGSYDHTTGKELTDVAIQTSWTKVSVSDKKPSRLSTTGDKSNTSIRATGGNENR